MAKQGLDAPRAGARKAPAPVATKERTGPREYLGEVRGEMRKVAWPTRPEVVNSTIIVIIAVTVMTALIFGFDYASAKLVLFLYD
jgi:preprotein translocase subunit SecE